MSFEALLADSALKATFHQQRVVITAPSYQYLKGAVRDGFRWARGTFRMKALGFQVRTMRSCLAQCGRFSGSDALRADDFNRALTMDDVDLVMAMRGGYGMVRILPQLNWDAIAQRAPNALGYSDFTAFNLALFSQCGLPSWQGPMLTDMDRCDPFTMHHVQAVFQPHFEVSWTMDDVALNRATRLDAQASPQTLEGLIWGGNLSMITSIVGSPWLQAQRFAGGILFLEDVAEVAYRVERMLLTLLEAGILTQQKAIVLGDFEGIHQATRFATDHTLTSVVAYLRARLPDHIPILHSLPFGHIAQKVTLPVGRMGQLHQAGTQASLRW